MRISAPRRVADTPQLQALLEDLADPSATIYERDGSSEEDTSAANVQHSGRLGRGISSNVLNEEAQNSPAVSTGPSERPIQTTERIADSLVRRIGPSIVRKSGPRRVADTPQLQALPEDLANPSATISEGDKNSEEDRAKCPTSYNELAAKRQRRVDWQEMPRFDSNEQWQTAFGNEGHFVLHNTRYTTKVPLKTLHCTYAKKAGWHHCPNQLRAKFLAGGQVV